MSRQALGKGLDALLRKSGDVLNTTAAVTEGVAVQKIPIDKIVPNRFQPRRVFNQAKLEELSSSIKKHGLTQPVVVVFDAGLDKYELVVGERRWRASGMAGLKEIDAIVQKALSDKELSALALIENIQREDLNPIETALGYKNLISKFHISQNEIAEFCGKSKAAISNSLRLLELEKEIQDAVESGIISEGHGRTLLSVADSKKRLALFGKIKKTPVSVRQLENMVKALTLPPPAKKAKSLDVKTFENDLQQTLGTKVEVKYGKKMSKGTLVIHYSSLDQLDNIASRLKTKML